MKDIIKEWKIDKCIHCRKKIEGEIIYFFENKKVYNPKTEQKEIKKCKIYKKDLPSKCEICKDLPLCKSCEIIMCNLSRHIGKKSQKYPEYCSDCIDRLKINPKSSK